MTSISFKALTVCLLYTVVCPQLAFSRENEEKGFCLTRRGIPICFEKTDSISICSAGVALPKENYDKCIYYSSICDAPGKFPIPGSPFKYYTCILDRINGEFEMKMESCTGARHFDPRTMQCLNQEELLISKGIPQETFGLTPRCVGHKIVPDSLDCKSFYLCDRLKLLPIKFFCGPGTYFNEKSKTCTNFMTQTCMRKFFNLQNNLISQSTKHFEAIREILEDEYKAPSEETSYPEDSETEPGITEYDNDDEESGKRPEENDVHDDESDGKPVPKIIRGVKNTEGSILDEIRRLKALNGFEENEERLQELRENHMLMHQKQRLQRNRLREKMREKHNFFREKMREKHNRMIEKMNENMRTPEGAILFPDQFPDENSENKPSYQTEYDEEYPEQNGPEENQSEEDETEKPIIKLKFIRIPETKPQPPHRQPFPFHRNF